VLSFVEAVKRDLDTDRIHLMFNNAGIGGGGGLVDGSHAEWEKTFNVCWYGVYFCTRAFVPLLRNADEGHIVNTSSVNGFWASLGPGRPHTAYCAAKFAVKGFTEALMTDLALNAPHIKCSVVMPGHIGTDIPVNSRKLPRGSETAINIPAMRKIFAAQGIDVTGHSDDQIRAQVAEMEKRCREDAPTSGRSSNHHPRWCVGREMAHPRRQRCRISRRKGPNRARRGIQPAVLRGFAQPRRLED
jgi:NAD(P)-dependent dehydrogenase (short-subunit alcohol dehydrogenase family)